MDINTRDKLHALLGPLMVLLLLSRGIAKAAEEEGTQQVADGASPSEHLKQILHDRHYDKFVHPDKGTGKPTVLSVGVYINDISSIDEINMEMEMDIYLRLEWTDARLADLYNTTMSIHGSLMDEFWQPDPYFPSAKSVTVHTVLSKTRAMVLRPNGTIIYSIRLGIELACPMEFENYPMDDQTCSLYIESLCSVINVYADQLCAKGYMELKPTRSRLHGADCMMIKRISDSMPSSDLFYRWMDDQPVLYNSKMELPKFLMEKPPSISNYTNTGAYRVGVWSGIQMNVYLHRQFVYYLIQLYIPSALVVIVSWVSFWLDVESAPARVSLGVLTVLTITTQNANANSSMPQVSYIKAMDVWLASCLGFVFGALIEYALATTLIRKHKKTVSGQLGRVCRDIIATNFKMTDGGVVNGFNTVPDNEQTAERAEREQLTRSETSHTMTERTSFCHAKRVDQISRIAFPLAFTMFNVAYWILYFYILAEKGSGHGHGY